MRYKNKKIAIFGDSICTYSGYNPDGYLVYYEGQTALDLSVLTVADTWWMQVLHYFGAELAVNNSFSGSRVCGTEFPAANCDERINALADNGTPDAIIVYLGANDYGGGERLYGEGITCFEGAYAVLLDKLKCRYPSAERICVAGWRGIRKTEEPSMLENGDETRNFSMLNDIIRRLSIEYGCRLVDLEKKCDLYDSYDGVHPTGAGMRQIAQVFIDVLSEDV